MIARWWTYLREAWTLLRENWPVRRAEWAEDPCLPGIAGYEKRRRIEDGWKVLRPPQWRKFDVE